MANYEYVTTFDIGSYDSSQRSKIMQIETHLIRVICGDDWAKVHDAICHNTSLLTSKHVVSIQPCCRNSGDMFTSLGNTWLTYCIFEFLNDMYRRECATIDKSFRVMHFDEGDDNVTTSDHDSHERYSSWVSFVIRNGSLLGF